MKDKNSMFYWYPKIKNLDIPQPKTIMIEAKKDTNLKEQLEKAIDEIGIPCFLRTDQTSNKHDWDETCYVTDKEKLPEHIEAQIYSNFILPCNGFIFREFLDLNYSFKAFLGMPVAKERRYFIKDGKLQCRHPYWPEMSIRFWFDTKEPKNWKKQLALLNTETTKEVLTLTKYAQKVADIFSGYWSVDFAEGKDGTWYLIDMALGEDSFHWLDCKYCPDEMKKKYEQP